MGRGGEGERKRWWRGGKKEKGKKGKEKLFFCVGGPLPLPAHTPLVENSLWEPLSLLAAAPARSSLSSFAPVTPAVTPVVTQQPAHWKTPTHPPIGPQRTPNHDLIITSPEPATPLALSCSGGALAGN